jgi:hypothetical protein
MSDLLEIEVEQLVIAGESLVQRFPFEPELGQRILMLAVAVLDGAIEVVSQPRLGGLVQDPSEARVDLPDRADGIRDDVPVGEIEESVIAVALAELDDSIQRGREQFGPLPGDDIPNVPDSEAVRLHVDATQRAGSRCVWTNSAFG